MAEHVTQQQLRAFGQSELPRAELLWLDMHLSTCASCRRSLEAALTGSVIALHAELQTALPEQPLHLSFEQMARYVDETLAPAERALVIDHAASCAQCAVAVEDLRTFSATGAVAAVVVPTPVTATPNWWERLRELFQPFTAAPAFGLALTALLVIVLAGWLLRLAFHPQSATPQVANQPAVSPTSAPTLTSPDNAPTPESAPLLAQLNDGGGLVTLDQQGRLTGLENLPPAYQQMVKEALRAQPLNRPAILSELNRRGSSLLGADEQGRQFTLLAPVGKVVFTDRPAFRWTRLEGAASYVVEIYDAQFNLVLKSAALPATQWTPPQPLARGQQYVWQVKANQAGQEVIAPKPPATQARFSVLAQAQAAEIARARRAYANSHLTLGLLYAQAGLLDEAERELRALQAANPDVPAVQRLLGNVRALRR